MAAGEARLQFGRSVAANIQFWIGRTSDAGWKDLERLDGDRHNIYRAIEYGLAYPQGWPDTGQLLLQCALFVERRGHGGEWLSLFNQAVGQCGKEEQPLKCRLLNRLGQLHRQQREWDAALASHQEALAIARHINSDFLVAHSLYFLSAVHVNRGSFVEAERLGHEALAMFRNLEASSEAVESHVATTLNELGQAARWQGRLELSESHYRDAIALWRRLGEQGDLATSLINLAENLQAAGRLEEALPVYEEAIDLLGATGSRVRQALALLNLGALYHQRGEDLQAEATFRAVDLPFLRRTGNTFYLAIAAQGLGTVLMSQGRLEAAASYLQQSHALWSQLGDAVNLANAKGSWAELLAIQGRAAESTGWYEAACRLLADHPDHAWGQKLLAKFSQALQNLQDRPGR